jgi:hypothetical protein
MIGLVIAAFMEALPASICMLIANRAYSQQCARILLMPSLLIPSFDLISHHER